MGTLVAEVAALGLAVAFTSPVSVVTVIVLLSMPSGRRRAVAYRRREPSKGGQSTPKWLGRIEQTHWLLAVAVGAVMLSYGLSLAAASEILKANVSRLDSGVAVAVFAVTSILTVAAPIAVALVAPDRAAQRLEAWKAWLLGNSRAVVLVVLMVVAAFLIVRGIHDLIA